ncbi:MAG: methionyl-tRNA formyltransferase, partial [Solirubrobacteraceae bacterium]
MRVAYLGTSTFAVAVLRRLAESPHRPVLVVTPPDRPQGRGRRVASPPVAVAAPELGLELVQTKSVNEPDAAGAVRAARPDVGVVCAFGQLITEPLLSDLLMLNVHPSLLPRWRGAAPIERAIMAGDAQTGVSIIRVTAGLDSGPIALQQPLEIAAREDYGELSARLADLAGDLILRALDLTAADELELADQDESRACYAEKISAEERRLDPARPAVELERTVRALNPHIGAYIELDGEERLVVRVASAEATRLQAGRLAASDGA